MLSLIWFSCLRVFHPSMLCMLVPPVATSDHRTIHCSPSIIIFLWQNLKSAIVTVLRESNVKAFLTMLNAVNFRLMYDMRIYIDDKCLSLRKVIQECFACTIPTSTEIMTSSEKSLINQRWTLIVVRTLQNIGIWVWRQKPCYQSKSFSGPKELLKTCPKELWKTVNVVRYTSSSRSSALDVISKSFPCLHQAVENINCRFSSKQIRRTQVIDAPYTSDTTSTPEWRPILVTTVFKALSPLKYD